jgi:hypothetical protein
MPPIDYVMTERGHRKPETETGNGNGNRKRKPEPETGNGNRNRKRKPDFGPVRFSGCVHAKLKHPGLPHRTTRSPIHLLSRGWRKATLVQSVDTSVFDVYLGGTWRSSNVVPEDHSRFLPPLGRESACSVARRCEG